MKKIIFLFIFLTFFITSCDFVSPPADNNNNNNDPAIVFAKEQKSATSEIENYINLNGYSNELADEVRAIIIAAVNEIDKATSKEELTDIITNAKLAIENKINPPVDLTNDRVLAKTTLRDYKDFTKYTKDNQDKLEAAITAGSTAIDKAKSVAEINEAVANAKLAMNAIEIDLTNDKLTAKTTLRDYKDFTKYTVENQTLLQNAITIGNNAIDAAKSVDEINTAVANAKTAMDAVQKIVNYTNISVTVTPYLEGLTVLWADSAKTNYEVYYKKTSTSSYTKVDGELIKVDGSNIVCNIVGLEKGNYDVKVVNEQKVKEGIQSNVTINAFDRSGYAHFGYSSGIGAYNDNGTLKDNTAVIYVSNATKNTVTYKGYTGIAQILQNASTYSVPLNVRILDKITTAQYKPKTSPARLSSETWDTARTTEYFTNTLESTDVIKNIRNEYKQSTKTTSYNGKSYYDDDSVFNMIEIKNAKNITVEGIGKNAELFQWGLNFASCNSVEVRNLTFTDYPEDACAVTGGNQNDASGYGNFFIHHNVFNKGKNNWDLTVEKDKGSGDGATDISYVHNVTLSYNTYNSCKKTGLVGGSDNTDQYNYTFHHNYYNQPGSRLPLARNANMHMYNNYYYKAGTCQDIRMNAYVLSEANYFEGSSIMKTLYISSSYPNARIKSFNDVFSGGCHKMNGTIVTSREQIVSNSNAMGNFDTDSTKFYYDSINKKSNVTYLTTAEQAKTDALVLSGLTVK